MFDKMRNWSSLTDVLLETIADLLLEQSPADYIRFSCVCKSWHSAAPKQPPYLIGHQHDCLARPTIHSFYALSISNDGGNLAKLPFPDASLGALCCGCSYGWMVLLYPTPALRLYNPSTQELLDLPKVKLHNTYLRDGWFHWVGWNITTRKTFMEFHQSLAGKVLLTADPLKEASKCVVVSIRKHWRKVEYCRLGDKEWKAVLPTMPKTKSNTCLHADVILRGQQIYFACQHKIYSAEIGLKSSQKPTRWKELKLAFDQLPRLSESYEDLEVYFVESDGQLLVVYVMNASNINNYWAEVYELQLDKKLMLKKGNLGDYAFFLGTNLSYSVSARSNPGVRGNCIYLAEYFKSDRTRVLVIDLCDGGGVGFIANHLTYPDTNWKPCAWFMPHP